MKEIPNFSLYLADEQGNIWSKNYKRTGQLKMIKPAITGGYLKSMFKSDNGKYVTSSIHKMVAMAYHGVSDLEVNHINGIKTDNRPENLEYCTRSYNCQHSFNIGLQHPKKGELNGNSKLTPLAVKEIRLTALNSGRYYGRKALAEKFGVSEAHIKDIVTGRRNIWGHIK